MASLRTSKADSGDFSDRALSRSFLSPFVFLPYLAAFVLSLISFHTTYYGMRSFYGLGTATSQGKSTVSDPIANSISQYLNIDIDNLFALCFAAVVQGGILLASAYLFRIIFDRQARAGDRGSRFLPYFVSTVLLLLLPISIVFSYGARLEWQIGSEQKAVIQASNAYSDATDMLNTLKGMLREEGERLSTSTSELPSFKNFQDNMNQLAAAVARAPQTMQAYLKSVESVEADKRAAERLRQAEASQLSLDFERRAQLFKNSIAKLDQDIERVGALANSPQPSTADFDARIAQLEAEMTKEQNGTGSCGIAGEGACFKRFKAQKDRVEAQKLSFKQQWDETARANSEKLTALKKEKIAKSVELENVVDQARIAGYEVKIDSQAIALDDTAELPKKIEALRATVGQHGVDLKQALDGLAAGFSIDIYARAVEQCQKLRPLTQIADASLKKIDCEPAELAPAVAAITEFQRRSETFNAACTSPSAYVNGAGDAYVGQTFDRVNRCMELSGLGAQDAYKTRMSDLSDTLSKAISSRSVGVDYLTFTLEQLRDGKRVAIIALFFAIAVDILVLVFTCLGELPRLNRKNAQPLTGEDRQQMFDDLQAVNDAIDTSDPMKFRFPRAVITCLDTEKREGLHSLDLNRLADEEDRRIVLRRLSPFVATGLAWHSPAASDVWIITDRGMRMLTQECRRVLAMEEKAASSPVKQSSAEHLKRAV